MLTVLAAAAAFLLAILLIPHHIGIMWREDVYSVFWRCFPFQVTYRKEKLIVRLFGKRIRFDRKKEPKLNEKAETAPKEVNEVKAPKHPGEKSPSTQPESPRPVQSEKITPLPKSVRESLIVPDSKQDVPAEPFTDDDADEFLPESREQKSESSEQREKPKRKSGIEQIRAFWNRAVQLWNREKKFILGNKRWLTRFLKRSWLLLRPISFQVKMSGGFADPSETGVLFGITEMLSSQKRSGTRSYIEFTPRFPGPTQWHSKGTLFWRTSLAVLILWGVSTVLTYPWIQAFLCWRRNRRTAKNQDE